LPSMRGSRHEEGPTGWSLEHRLPVLLSVLLAGVVGGLSYSAYREVRDAAVIRATDRLERVGRELLAGGSRATIVRAESLHAVAADRVVARAMTGAATQQEIQARLAATHDPGDSTLVGWQVSSLADGPRFGSASGWSARDSTVLAMTADSAVRSASDRHSAFYSVGTAMHTWTAVPVYAGRKVVGTVAELRRVGDNTGADASIRGIIDDAAHMLFTSRGAAEWLSPRGHPVPAPFTPPGVEGKAVKVHGPSGAAYAVQYALPTTPWMVVLFQSEASVLRRPQEFLRRLLLAGMVVLAIATAGAWILSRHVTRPLRDVTDAAAALAHGNLARRVRVSGGGREIASLAANFNAMAVAIGDAHLALADRNTELQQANAAKSQFLAMMSHELRTPLNAIGGFTELLELGLRGPVTAEQVEDLGRIRRNKDLLLSIIADILEFARADAGALTVKANALSIAPLLADVTDLVGAQIASKGLRLTVGPVPAGAVARGDLERVQQVLLNLLSNATKFTDPGGEITVETTLADGEVRIAVRDTGRGIDAAQLEAIFEPFVQVDASLTRRTGGTGLGLAIARKLTAAMGGRLTVQSALGTGSTFMLALPHAEATAAPNAEPLGHESDERQPA
jgi:signal transduction histidine kinase